MILLSSNNALPSEAHDKKSLQVFHARLESRIHTLKAKEDAHERKLQEQYKQIMTAVYASLQFNTKWIYFLWLTSICRV